MLNIPRNFKMDFEQESQMSNPFQSIQEKMWEHQLGAKQIVINGDIKEDLIEKAVLQIFNFNLIDTQNEIDCPKGQTYEREPISILINSSGGTIDEAFSLISAILSSQTPIHTLALGKAYSSGFMILLAGHKRYAQKYSSLMFHQGAGGVIDNFAKIHDYSAYVLKLQNKIDQFVMKQTKIKEKKLREIFQSQHDWYLDSEEALLLGVIHGII
jgi:ATP-dependent Clp protease, protease subunit